MGLPTSGQISLNQVNIELGNNGTDQIEMNNPALRGLFGLSSGQISMADGYGKANSFAFTIASNTQEADLSTLATAAGWDGTTGVLLTIDAGVYLWSDHVNTAGLLVNIPNSTIINNGYIIGKGGSATQNGGSAMSIQSTGITITNGSGAYIAGGGGGGGGSYGGGGAGQSGALGDTSYTVGGWSVTTNGSWGSPYGATNSFGGGPSGTPSSYSQGHGGTGGSGAYAGYWQFNALNGSGGTRYNYYHGGAAGGRALFGGYQPTSGNYGGFWGAAGGGGGGAGGDAISSSQTYSLTNNGTIYGAT
jgi:hypothetical protein